MSPSVKLLTSCALLAFCFAVSPAQADVRLPALLSDHMVLQQDLPVRVWGRAEPGETVTIAFQSQKTSTTADAEGKWALYLMPLQPGGPFQMTVSGRNTLLINDVLIGEVWVGSGQSNMVWPVSRSNNSEQEIAQADFPKIRLFQVKLKVADQPADDVEGAWQLCGPGTVPNFSAVGYFFAREIHQRRRVPVGMIQSAWGGTPAQSWTSRPALEADPALKYVLDEWQQVLADYPAAQQRFEKQFQEWKQAAAAAKAEGKTPSAQPRLPVGPGHQNTPAGLYNAMIAPLTRFAIRGVIWYQGESNANKLHALPYRRLFRAMIEDWRRAWSQGSFPFLFVQLANFQSNGLWPELRESQLLTLALRDTAMAVTIDIGESKDIHPKNKQDVGRRLALAARAIAYGENLVHSGPVFRQLTKEGSRLRLWFDHVGSGLEVRGGGALTGFTIAAKDGNFLPATATLDGNSLLVSNPEIKDPVAVRYAWADDPLCNLINKDGLPASPFRTDTP
jgi:sialate O-acetylesterase